MPTRKIADVEHFHHCTDPDHDVPNMCYFPPGMYEHECPACHRKIVFHGHGTRLRDDTGNAWKQPIERGVRSHFDWRKGGYGP